MGFRIILLFLLSLVTIPAQAGMDEALTEINDTVHGITATHAEKGVLWLDVIDVGADYNFMALVTCSLLKKHNIKDLTSVSVRDVLKAPEASAKAIGSYECGNK